MTVFKSGAVVSGLLLVAAAAHAEERSFPVTNFDRISSAGSADVFVTTGKAASVRAEGSKDALDRLDIGVSGDRLKLGQKKNSWNMGWSDSGKVKIHVTVPMVRGVDLSGSGMIKVDTIKVPEFSAAISGSGEAHFPALDADLVRLSISGSGEFDASGRCGEARVDVAGSGDVRIGGLRCTSLRASIAGSGDIDAYATQTANISIAGSGDARIRGGAKCTTSKAGSGDVTCS
jgi:hypothetical protein